jgi:hypothetical protein
MKKLYLLLLLPLAVNAQNYDGPFGFDIGSDISEYDDCSETDSPGMYRCASAKKSHPDIEYYIVQYFEGVGICWIKGIGRDINDNGYGNSTKAIVDKIHSQLEGVYGKSTKDYNFLSAGSIWDERNDWMMGVAKDERYYNFFWTEEDGYKKIKNIKNIMLSAKALSSSTGYFIIEFAGENEDRCDSIANSQGSSAF